MNMLDLKHINLGDKGLYRSALKRDAVAVAKRFGWRAKDVVEASNRFSIFWVVCQPIGTDTFRFVKSDGSVIDILMPAEKE